MPCLKKIINENEVEIQNKLEKIKASVKLCTAVLLALELGRFLARKLLETELLERNKEKCTWPRCEKCRARLENKKSKDRSIKSLVGTISWKRKIGRCPNNCEIRECVPLDRRLGLKPNQRASNELRKVGCMLSVFIPYSISSLILKALTGIKICPKTIWNWSQIFGNKASEIMEYEMLLLDSNVELPVEKLAPEISDLPLVAGGDGVFVPFRPNECSPDGEIIWREIKVGIFARMKSYTTKKGKKALRIVHKRLVAVRTEKEKFHDMMRLEAHKQQLQNAKTAAWISDGGTGFWGTYRKLFSSIIGILDFYHAAQYLWKFARIWLDGRTKNATQWFHSARHFLRRGDVTSIGCSIDTQQILESDPKSKLCKSYNNLTSYLLDHMEHVDYDHFKSLDLPIGSGMVESSCKWLVQQRFKGTGMRWSFSGFDNLLSLRLAWVNQRFDKLFF